jgi:hypothetical protein
MADLLRLYRVRCCDYTPPGAMTVCYWARDSAIQELLDQQQRGWDSIAMEPVVLAVPDAPPPDEETPHAS